MFMIKISVYLLPPACLYIFVPLFLCLKAKVSITDQYVIHHFMVWLKIFLLPPGVMVSVFHVPKKQFFNQFLEIYFINLLVIIPPCFNTAEDHGQLFFISFPWIPKPFRFMVLSMFHGQPDLYYITVFQRPLKGIIKASKSKTERKRVPERRVRLNTYQTIP